MKRVGVEVTAVTSDLHTLNRQMRAFILANATPLLSVLLKQQQAVSKGQCCWQGGSHRQGVKHINSSGEKKGEANSFLTLAGINPANSSLLP